MRIYWFKVVKKKKKIWFLIKLNEWWNLFVKFDAEFISIALLFEFTLE